MTELHLLCTQLFKLFAPTSSTCIPLEGNTLRRSNTLLCCNAWLSFPIQLVVVAVLRNPIFEFGVGRIINWHQVVQMLKSYSPNVCQISLACPPVESNTLELSNTLLSHETWLSFLLQPIVAALLRNPPPELGVCSVLVWHEAVTEFRLEFTQLLNSYVPHGCHTGLACPPLEFNTLELSDALLCHEIWLSLLMQPFFECAESQPTAQACGLQRTDLARGSDRIPP